MSVKKVAPAMVAERGGFLGRADDVGEEHGGEDAVGLRRRARPGQERLDLVGELVDVSGRDPVVGPRSSTNFAPGILVAK